MSEEREVQQFDFRRGSNLPVNVEQRLLDWERSLCAIAAENWGQCTQTALAVEHRGRTLETLLQVRQQFPDTSLGCRCGLGDDGPTTLFVLPRPLALALIDEMLGEAVEAIPEDRELTAAEGSLCQLLFEELSRAVGEAWPDQHPLVCRVMGLEPKPQRTRLYPLTEQVLWQRFAVTGVFGSQEFFWILPRQGIRDFIAARGTAGRMAGARSAALLEQLVREIPAELVVRLGEAQLDVAELAKLNVGDVVILDQRITEPLVATVAGMPKFSGRPGRVGPRQAFQIESTL
jgi:flagellar motor switch protein FliM